MFLLLLVLTGALHAEVLEHVPEDLSLLRNPHFHILVVSILEVENRFGTNAQPPLGKLNIEEVLRGRDVGPGGKYGFELLPSDDSLDYRQGTQELRPEWFTRSLIGPKPRDRLLVFVYTTKERLKRTKKVVLQGPLIRYSKANRTAVRTRMAAPERSWWIQFPVGVLVILMPFLSMILYKRFKGKNAMKDQVQRLPRIVLLLPLTAVALYAFYESGVSTYSNIRVDLILLWPAVIMSVILLVRYLMLYTLRARGLSTRGRPDERK